MPSKTLYGKQTKLAMANFPISGIEMPHEIVRILAFVKMHAALVNGELGVIPKGHAKAIASAASKVSDGKYADQFPVDIFQTGSGTSTNMNMNEVLANLASTTSRKVHPNDHVNAGQSSNDVIPTAIQIACAMKAQHVVAPALLMLIIAIDHRAEEWEDIVTTSRTHMMDAVPIRLSKVFSGYGDLLRRTMYRLGEAVEDLTQLPLGGTAAGTGLNAHPKFAKTVIKRMCDETDLALEEARNHYSAQSCPLPLLHLSSALREVAVALGKIAQDLRMLNSGPLAGMGDIMLPELQPGSSHMPGKVNPVLCETLLQVSAYVEGVDTTVQSTIKQTSNFELCTGYPVVGYSLIAAMRVITNATEQFMEQYMGDLEPNRELIAARTERNPMLAAALAPRIGYDKAAAIAKEAMQTGETIAEVAQRKTDLAAKDLKKLLDPKKMC